MKLKECKMNFELILKEGFDTDDSVVRELKIFIDNDGELYRQRTMPIMKNLARKMRKGNYDPSKATKLWMYLVNDGAKKYAKEFGGDPKGWHEMFPKAIRMAVAQELADEFQSEVDAGGYDVEELSMRENKVVRVSKSQLREMVRKTIRKQLNEAAGSREWDLLEKIRDGGADDTSILEELMRAMSSVEATQNLEWIAQMWDVELEGDDDGEDEAWMEDDDLDEIVAPDW